MAIIETTDKTFAVQAHPDSRFFYGIYLALQHGETVRELLERSVTFALPSMYPVIINMPCGESFECKSLDDFPTTDELCTCGNPLHYFIKIGEI